MKKTYFDRQEQIERMNQIYSQPEPPLELRVIKGVSAITRKETRMDCELIVINEDENRHQVTGYIDPYTLNPSFVIKLRKKDTAGLVGNGKRLRIGNKYYMVKGKLGEQQPQETAISLKNRYDDLWRFLQNYKS